MKCTHAAEDMFLAFLPVYYASKLFSFKTHSIHFQLQFVSSTWHRPNLRS